MRGALKFHKYGDEGAVRRDFERFCEQDTTGIITKNLVLFTFDAEQFTPGEIATIVNQMIECTGYCKSWYEKMVIAAKLQ